MMTDELILHLWEAFVGDTTLTARPLNDDDKIAFANAVLNAAKESDARRREKSATHEPVTFTPWDSLPWKPKPIGFAQRSDIELYAKVLTIRPPDAKHDVALFTRDQLQRAVSAAIKEFEGMHWVDLDKALAAPASAGVEEFPLPEARETAEPVAFVPVHPRNGPLWMDTYDAKRDVSEARTCRYPLMSLYAAPVPQAEPSTSRVPDEVFEIVRRVYDNIEPGALAENRQHTESVVQPYLDAIMDELRELDATPRGPTAREVARQTFALCEWMEETPHAPPADDLSRQFQAGKAFAAKHIRNGLGNWLTDEENRIKAAARTEGKT